MSGLIFVRQRPTGARGRRDGTLPRRFASWTPSRPGSRTGGRPCRTSACTARRLIIVGSAPIETEGRQFVQLVSRRYERGAIILTGNQSLGAWGEVFGDPVSASATLDRLLHHSIIVKIRGDSYRRKE